MTKPTLLGASPPGGGLRPKTKPSCVQVSDLKLWTDLGFKTEKTEP